MYARAEGDRAQDMTSASERASDQLLFSSILLGRHWGGGGLDGDFNERNETNKCIILHQRRKDSTGIGFGGGNIHEQVNKKQNNRFVVIKTLMNQTRPNKIHHHSHSASVTIFRASAL